ncbi:MAG: hypothetical protein ABI881_01975 [Betaproteobacteria bacterium]
MIARFAIAGAMLAPLCIAFAPAASANPPTRDEIAQWCADAEDTSHCNRLIEAQQLKRLPGLAARSGGDLKVTLFPSGSTTFTDVEDLHGGTSYSLWDNISAINAVVVSVTRDDRTTYTLLLRASGRKVDLPAEPALSPDRQHIVTADFCPKECSNEVALWQLAHDSVAKVASWKPSPTWSDAAVRWKDADTLAIDYTAMGDADARSQERKLGDKAWQPAAAR